MSFVFPFDGVQSKRQTGDFDTLTQVEKKMVQLLTYVAALGAFGAAAGVPLPSSKGELSVGSESVEPMVQTLCRLNA